MAYEDILNKYKKDRPKTSRLTAFKHIDSLEGNPYKDYAESYLNSKREERFQASSRKIDESIKKSQSFGSFVKGTVKRLPRSIAQVFTEPIKHPIKTASSVGGALLDVGPATVNTMSQIGSGALGLIYGKENAPKTLNLPKPGQTFNEWIGNTSDVQEAIATGTQLWAGYSLGQAGVTRAGLTGAKGVVAGDIVGGQLITDEGSLKERGKQMLFDAAFGVVEVGAGKAFKAYKTSSLKKSGFTKAIDDATTQAALQLDARGTVASRAAAHRLRELQKSADFSKFKNFDDYVAATRQAVGDSISDSVVAGDLDIFNNYAVTVYKGVLESVPGTKVPDLPNFKRGQRVKGNDVSLEAVDDIDLGEELMVKDSDILPPSKQKAVDMFDPEKIAEMDATAKAREQKPKTRYIKKADLGSENGQPVMAKTEVDAKTGNAVIYYRKELDGNPKIRQTVFDHEEGHILDKRLAGDRGSNFSPALLNSTNNADMLRPVLEDIATSFNKSVDEVAASLTAEVKKLSGQDKDFTEQFADAYSRFRANRDKVTQQAPHFAALMDYKMNSPFKGKTTTPKSFKERTGQDVNLNKLGKQAELKEAQSKVAKVTKETEVKTAKATEKLVKGKETKIDTTTAQADGKIGGTGLDTGKRVKGRLSFNPDKIRAPQDVEVLFSKMEAKEGSFAKQRISKSNEDIKDLSRLVGLTPEQLAGIKPGSVANAETIQAARQLVTDKARKLADYTRSIDPATASNAELKELKNRFVELVSMQKTVAGFRTEASNALRSFGIEVAPGENILLNELLGNLKKLDVASADDMALFSAKIADQYKLGKMQKLGKGFLEVWYSAILSGPKTTVRNILSTFANIATELGTKAINPKQWKELGPAIGGLSKGLREGIGEAKIAWKAGDTDPGKFFHKKLANESVFTGKLSTFGKVVESVGNFLGAQDIVMSAGAREMEKASLRVYKSDISDSVMDAISKHFAEQTVYRGEPKGKILRSLVGGAESVVREAPILRVIVPFIRVVGNVIDRQFDYLPVFNMLRARSSVLAKQAEDIALKFKITDANQIKLIEKRLFDQQVGRIALGTGMATAAVGLSAVGRVSGSGPSNYSERLQLQRTGWRPNSIKIGDTWVPYTYLGPLGGIFAIGGNVHDKVKYDNLPDDGVTGLVMKGIVGWGQTQLDQSFFRGAADLLDVLANRKDPKKYLVDLGAGLVPIPKAYSQTLEMSKNVWANLTDDPVFKQQYETRDIVSKIRKELGLTGDFAGLKPLNPRLDQFGEPMTVDFIFGISPSKEKDDSARVENVLIENGTYVALPSRHVKYSTPDGERRKMTEDEYQRYTKISGKRIYQRLTEEYGYLRSATPAEVQEEVTDIVRSIREDTRLDILE